VAAKWEQDFLIIPYGIIINYNYNSKRKYINYLIGVENADGN